MTNDFEVVRNINMRMIDILSEVSNSHNIPFDQCIRLFLEALHDDSVVEALWSKMLSVRNGSDVAVTE